MSSWRFSWFRIINDNQCFFTLNLLFNEVDRGLGHEKKSLSDTIDTICIAFFKKKLLRMI